MTTHRRGWRWTNFPVSEAHLIIGAVGVILGLIWPLKFGWDGPWPLVVGVVLIVVGVGSMIWATATAGKVLLADPDHLVTEGPYVLSRHPMYLGWTFVYLGSTVMLDSVWLLILLPILAVWIHRETMREERRMLERFGDDYVTYQKRVRRYL